ncbi:hypothetical protein R84981_002792 [Carnimonas sp. R-84981]|uniref:hypothetical protein n=1 Tax=Carnimonas bestiolae TaxID=3402172 RepID=UPI003EDB709A
MASEGSGMKYDYCNATEIAARLPHMMPMNGRSISADSIRDQLAPITEKRPSDSLIIDAVNKVRERGLGVEIKRLDGQLFVRRLV